MCPLCGQFFLDGQRVRYPCWRCCKVQRRNKQKQQWRQFLKWRPTKYV